MGGAGHYEESSGVGGWKAWKMAKRAVHNKLLLCEVLAGLPLTWSSYLRAVNPTPTPTPKKVQMNQ